MHNLRVLKKNACIAPLLQACSAHLQASPLPNRQQAPLADVQGGCWAIGKVGVHGLECAHVPHLDLAINACMKGAGQTKTHQPP